MYRNICKQALLLSLVLLVLTAPCAWPQASIATLTGTVRDQSGAVIPGASVTLTKTDTNEISTSVTNSAGFYEFPGLVPGPYVLAVESKGMEKFEGGLTVQVQQRAVVDVAMRVGKTTAVVTVADVTPLVETNNGTVSSTLEQTRIQQLPINGRTVSTLLETIPGMEAGKALGAPFHSDSFTLDGADFIDREGINDLMSRQPGLDSIQEFNVITNGTSAQFERPTAIVLSTKSGTNKLHGNAFEDIRNNDLMYARTRTTYTPAPYLNRNEFGANVGGPVYIPKLYNGKDKTFFWFGYEALRTIDPTEGVSYPVPTQAWRQGNLAGDIDNGGIPYVIYNPYTTNTKTYARTPYTNNVITTPESPLATYLLNLEPLPTLANVNPNIANNWQGETPAFQRNWTVTARIDHRFGEKDAIYGRYYKGDYELLSAVADGPASSNLALNPANTQEFVDPGYSFALSWVHTFSPTLFNEVTATGSWLHVADTTGDLAHDYDATLGLPNPFGTGGWPDLNTYAFPNNPTTKVGLTWEAENANADHQYYGIIDDNATKVWRKHQFQFGFHYRNDQEDLLPQQQQVAGEVDTETNGTSLYNTASIPSSPLPLPYTGDNFANFYIGDAEYDNQLVRGKFYGREKEYAFYFQDNWKMSPRLTVNLGLRYDFYPAFTEKNNITVGFDPTYNQGQTTGGLLSQGAEVLAPSIAKLEAFGYTFPSIIARNQLLGWNSETTAQAGQPSGLQTSNKLDFAPRLGFAYRLTEGARPFVVRGGYSLAYIHPALDPWSTHMRINAPMDLRYYYSLTQATYSPDGLANYGLRTVPTVIAGQNSSNIVSTTNADAIQPGSSAISYLGLHQPDPHVHTWNLTLQKELPWNMVLTASYVGNHSSNLQQYYAYNNPTPAFIWYTTTKTPLPTGTYASTATNYYNQNFWGQITEILNSGWGNSQGAEVQVKRTFKTGSVFEFFYTRDNDLGTSTGTASTPSTIPTPNEFLPGVAPVVSGVPSSVTGSFKALDRQYTYERDTSVPHERYSWNFLQDVPVGRGKRFLSGAGKLDKLVGGWQIAGLGSKYSTYFELPTADFPTGTPVQLYKYKYKIQNCTSGTCYPAYLWYNGYISPQLINSVNASGQPNGYEGVPSNYKAAWGPLVPYGATSAPNAPSTTVFSKYWNTNEEWVPLSNGTTALTTWSGFSPQWQQYYPGNWEWSMDASLIKNIPFKEGRVNLRLECDWFNVFNHPGNPASIGTDGTLSLQTSGPAGARTLQLVGRISF